MKLRLNPIIAGKKIPVSSYESLSLQDAIELEIGICPLAVIQSYFDELKPSSIDSMTIIKELSYVFQQWTEPDNPYVKQAIELLPSTTGFSTEMIRVTLKDTFEKLLQEDLSIHPIRPQITLGQSRSVTHILAGNVYVSGLFGIIYGILAGVPQIIKPSSHEPLFPYLFVQSIIEYSPQLADRLSVIYWHGGDESYENIVSQNTDKVVAYGDDESIAQISAHLLKPDALLGFGHQFSFSVIAKESLLPETINDLAYQTAIDFSMYDQQGCMSPLLIWVQADGNVSPAEFAVKLSEQMQRIHEQIPRGKISLPESAQIRELRAHYQLKSYSLQNIRVYSSTPGTDWTVIYTNEPGIQFSCLNRVALVKPFVTFPDVLSVMLPFAGKIQVLGHSVLSDESLSQLKEWAFVLEINKLCAIGQMQFPLLSDRHPGKPNPDDFRL